MKSEVAVDVGSQLRGNLFLEGIDEKNHKYSVYPLGLNRDII